MAIQNPNPNQFNQQNMQNAQPGGFPNHPFRQNPINSNPMGQMNNPMNNNPGKIFFEIFVMKKFKNFSSNAYSNRYSK